MESFRRAWWQGCMAVHIRRREFNPTLSGAASWPLGVYFSRHPISASGLDRQGGALESGFYGRNVLESAPTERRLQPGRTSEGCAAIGFGFGLIITLPPAFAARHVRMQAT